MKILVDAMLGKLARFLRIFGYDTVYANDLEDYFSISPVPDNKLLEYAIEDERIIITRDYLFHKKARNNSIYLEGEGVYNYLNKLEIKLGLSYNFDMQIARCSVCNSDLEEVKDKRLIQEDVQTETYKHYNEFFQCKNPKCNKVFWKGTHIEDIISRLKK
jgi:uncharacterized protein with PIN domain